MNFTDEQKQIINQIDGPVIAVACPGSGKTTTILERVNHMIETGIDPKNILVVTFTKNAADEMGTRFKARYKDCDVHFSTIHSLCLCVLKWYYGYENYIILPDEEKYKHYEELLKDRVDNADIRSVTEKILSAISYIKNAMISLEEAKMLNLTELQAGLKLEDIYPEYESWKRSINKRDFDDILIDCDTLFQTKPDILEQWQDLYKYIIIDEFQDTNKIQARIFYKLADKYKNICVVGDDDQSIYGFRSADSTIMLNFDKTFPDAKEYFLSTNYRCDKNIVKAADNLIRNNEIRFDKAFLTHSQNDGIIKHKHFTTSAEQIASLVRSIEARHKIGVPYEDMAILYRVNKTAMSIAPFLKNNHIPFNIKDRVDDLHKEVFFHDVKTYWRVVNNQGSLEDYKGILLRPTRYFRASDFNQWLNESMLPANYRDMEDILLTRSTQILEEEVRYIKQGNAFNMDDQIKKARNAHARRKSQLISLFTVLRSLENQNPSNFVRILLNDRYREWLGDYCKYKNRDVENVLLLFDQLKKEARNFDSMEDWFEYAKGYNNYMKERIGAKDGVTVLTFHGSKGLEWSDVYIVEANEDVTPYAKAETDSEMEEERRMFYVAATRAKHQLLIYSSEKPSRFIEELKLPGTKNRSEKNDKLKAKAKVKSKAS